MPRMGRLQSIPYQSRKCNTSAHSDPSNHVAVSQAISGSAVATIVQSGALIKTYQTAAKEQAFLMLIKSSRPHITRYC
jgi:hypothetical protein